MFFKNIEQLKFCKIFRKLILNEKNYFLHKAGPDIICDRERNSAAVIFLCWLGRGSSVGLLSPPPPTLGTGEGVTIYRPSLLPANEKKLKFSSHNFTYGNCGNRV